MVLNIQNLKYDYCFLWCILEHIYRVENYDHEMYNYRKYFNELKMTGLHFPVKFSYTPKFEYLKTTISVNVVVYENNEVFPLYTSKHRDRKHHVNVPMISNSESKFHCLLVRNLSALVYGRTKYHGYTHV